MFSFINHETLSCLDKRRVAHESSSYSLHLLIWVRPICKEAHRPAAVERSQVEVDSDRDRCNRAETDRTPPPPPLLPQPHPHQHTLHRNISPAAECNQISETSAGARQQSICAGQRWRNWETNAFPPKEQQTLPDFCPLRSEPSWLTLTLPRGMKTHLKYIGARKRHGHFIGRDTSSNRGCW